MDSLKIMGKNLIVIAPLLSFLLSCQTNESKINNVSASEAKSLVEDGRDIFIIDVRTEEEYQGGYIPLAINLNYYDKNFEVELNKLDKSKSILLYCQSGGRSSIAAGIAQKLGFKKVYNLQGGIMAWKSAGFSITSNSTFLKNNKTDDFYAEISKYSLVLVDFYAPWCAPCKKMMPILNEIEQEYSEKLKIIRINVDENDQLTNELGIQNLPTLQLYRNGKLIETKIGFLTKNEIISALNF